MKILVLGGYGLIGSDLVRRLVRDGHQVIGFGRDLEIARRVLPDIPWRQGDLRGLTTAQAWEPLLADIEAVVNCSGALQDGPDDDLETVHHHAVAALAQACATRGIGIVQISATGARPDASTVFLASKARGDLAVVASGAAHHIFRPGLVLARQSYGGTTLLRMLAAIPVIQPLAIPEARVQIISLGDVADAVSAAVMGKIPNGFVGDLVEDEAHTLSDIVGAVRHWLGFGPAWLEITVPLVIIRMTSRIADALAWLQWRSPLRATALRVLDDGVTGTPSHLTPYGLPPTRSLGQTLASMPAHAEDRLYARMALLMPFVIATLVLFWAASGLIGLAQMERAAQVLTDVGWSHGLALASVVFWAIVDLAIAAAFAYRPWAKRACWWAVLVSIIYLVASSLFVPSLWLDPLGPLVKVIPGIALSLVARVALDAR